MRQDHIRRYEGFLRQASSSRFVNVPETKRYLSIWQGMENKTYEQLSPVERGEVHDALGDGSYDTQLEDMGLLDAWEKHALWLSERCPRCEGAGHVRQGPRSLKCLDCNGSGKWGLGPKDREE